MHKDLEYVSAVLSTTPERWRRLIEALPVAMLARPPMAGEWSALNCLQHIVVTERSLFPVRFKAFLAGQDFDNFDPHQRHEDVDAQTPEELVATFVHQRQENLAMIEQVGDEDLKRTVQHPKFGTVTLAQMLHTWAAHDLNHTIQAERTLMQPLMLNCGGWRSFFYDHEVDASKQ